MRTGRLPNSPSRQEDMLADVGRLGSANNVLSVVLLYGSGTGNNSWPNQVGILLVLYNYGWQLPGGREWPCTCLVGGIVYCIIAYDVDPCPKLRDSNNQPNPTPPEFLSRPTMQNSVPRLSEGGPAPQNN